MDVSEPFDVIVLGTGVAGLCAAISAAEAGARVGLFEKAAQVGGTTALSGGAMWIPNNRMAASAGIQDSREAALAYLEGLSNGMMRQEMLETFVDTGPEVVEWFQSATPVSFSLIDGFPDYHPESDGAMPGGGRTLEPDLFDLTSLGDWRERIVGPEMLVLVAETQIGGCTDLPTPAVLDARLANHIEGQGRALVAGLLKGCLDSGIVPRLGFQASRLIMDEGSVRGVTFDTEQGKVDVSADAVVVATGGFERNPELVRRFLRGPIRFAPGAPSNTGDGLLMAMRVGAMLGNMREAWWIPVAVDGSGEDDGFRGRHLVLCERTVPGSIMINTLGNRFVNEAANYNALGGALHTIDANAFSFINQPCWLLFDQRCWDLYGGFELPPGSPFPDWILRANDLDALGQLIGVPADPLVQTVSRWNSLVMGGHDDDFQRGDSMYDGWMGDHSKYPGVSSTMGPVDAPPYYAVEVFSSTLGTSGGPETDVDGAVLDVDGKLIPGLYAAGNAMAGPMGMTYGGAGGTIGPGAVFGYRAGRRAAQGSGCSA
jgi:3-oxosteroid 1-dehydrogenase